jgi:TonB family protein
VLQAAVKQSTGDQAMAEAALRVTRIMKFQPAMMRDKAVESFTELPIHFSPR